MTTILEWVEAFRSPALTVTGVARYYDAPPESADISDGAIAYPWLFGFDNGDFGYSCSDLNDGFSMTYEVVTEAVAQDTLEENYDDVITMMENVRTALDGMTITNFISYQLVIMTRAIGNTNYWAIRATVTGQNGGL